MLLGAAEADGLDKPTTYGTSLGPPLRLAQNDEIALALPPDAKDPPPVSDYPVQNALPIVRAQSSAAPIIVSGDGEGLVDLATIGGLSGDNIILYSGTFADDPAALRQEASRPGALLVVTDSNRKRGRRWGAIKDIEGATERANETPLTPDDADAQLDVFPGSTTNAQTVVEEPGAQVSTSRYGNRITYWQEDRGSRAFDGDVNTAWEFGDHDHVVGEKIRLDLDQPITTDHVNLVQRLTGDNTRYITQATLTFDGKNPVTVNLDPSSRTPTGQTVTFPSRQFQHLEIRVDDTNVGNGTTGPTNDVGFAEIRVRDNTPGATDVRVDEIVRMPTDLVDTVGSKAADQPLVYQMSRSRTIVVPPRTAQDEPALVRRFVVPDARTFGAGGTIRLATAAPDAIIDSVLGIPDASEGGITVTASQHLPGTVEQRGSAAFDGNPATFWSTAFGAPTGQWVQVQTPTPETFSHLDLQVVADGRHSVPTQIQVSAGGETRTVDLPPIADQKAQNATVSVPVDFAPLTGDTARITISGIRPVTTTEYHELVPITMPVAIAEVGMPGVQRAPLPATLPSACRTDLLAVDGHPVGVRLSGSPAAAEALKPIDYQLCDPNAPATLTAAAATSTAAAATPATGLTLDLAKGSHLVRSAPGTATGIDVDGLVLGSDAGGTAMALGAGGKLPASATHIPVAAKAATPTVKVTSNGRTKIEVHVTGAEPGTPFWMVLGESNNAGWQATVAGKDVGGSTLVNGYANGWLVTPTTRSFDITLKWTPQNRVWISIVISVVVVLLCLFLAFRRRRKHKRDDARAAVFGAEFDGEAKPASPLVATGVHASLPALIGGPLLAFAVGRVVGAPVGRSGHGRGRARGAAATTPPVPAHLRRAGGAGARRSLHRGAAVPVRVLQRLRLAHALRAGERPRLVVDHPARRRCDGRVPTPASHPGRRRSRRQRRLRRAQERRPTERHSGHGAVTPGRRAFLTAGERRVDRLHVAVATHEEAQPAHAGAPVGRCQPRPERVRHAHAERRRAAGQAGRVARCPPVAGGVREDVRVGRRVVRHRGVLDEPALPRVALPRARGTPSRARSRRRTAPRRRWRRAGSRRSGSRCSRTRRRACTRRWVPGRGTGRARRRCHRAHS